MEGVCFALRDSIELMRRRGASLPEVRAIGGGARSRLWRRIQADVFDTPVTSVAPAGGPAYGAAMMAAVGAEMFGSIGEAADRWVSVEDRIEPDRRRVETYDELYEAYHRLYPSLKGRFSDTAALMERLTD